VSAENAVNCRGEVDFRAKIMRAKILFRHNIKRVRSNQRKRKRRQQRPTPNACGANHRM